MLSGKHLITGILFCMFCLVVLTFPAKAGGLYLNEFATPSTGNASAGSEAWGHDASTSFHNPAAMTRIKGTEIMGGFMGIW